MHKHKKPELVPLRRTKEPLGFYTLTVCLQTSLPPPPMSSVLKVSQCPFICLVPLVFMIFDNQFTTSCLSGLQAELICILFCISSLQTEQPSSEVLNTKSQRNSNKQSHFQQKAKLILIWVVRIIIFCLLNFSRNCL